MSVSSYTSPAWVDSDLEQGEINCPPPGEPMVTPESQTVPHTVAGAKPGPHVDRLARFGHPCPHAVAIPSHLSSGNAARTQRAEPRVPPHAMDRQQSHCTFWCQTLSNAHASPRCEADTYPDWMPGLPSHS